MIKICFNGNGFPWNQKKKMNRFIYVKKYSGHTVYLLYIYFSCWPAPKYSWTPPLVFPLKMSVISQTCSGWWLPKLSQQTKNIFKVGNVIKNMKNLVKFTAKHLRRGLFFNQVPDCKPTISSNRYSGTGVFLWVFNKHTAAPEEQDLLVKSLFIML